MARQRNFIDTNVYEEAKKRIHHIYDVYDNVVSSFSGGKDSGVLVNLHWEVAQERGLDKINVIFRDEELVPQAVLDNVFYYMQQPWTNFTWYAIPLRSTKYILGESKSIIFWTPHKDRQWLRPKPEWAETLNNTEEIYTQYLVDNVIASNYTGSVAIMTGVRASESLVRYRSVVNALNENYISASPNNTRVKLCKPIYDWEVDDIFKYFYDTGHRYTEWYEAQLWAGDTFRVATPLNTENSKKLDRWAKEDPVFYDRLATIFPEIRAQERYINDLDNSHIVKKYGKDLDGVREWINNNIPKDTAAYSKAIKELDRIVRRCKLQPAIYLPNGNAEYVLKQFMKGNYKRQIMPVKYKDRNKKRR